MTSHLELTYLLDTCVVSDFVKGIPKVVERLVSLPPSSIAISTITQMEIEYGLSLDEKRAKPLKNKIKALIDSITLLNFSSKDAVAAAQARGELKKLGLPIGSYDILIAGTALAQELILVTSNMREFSRIKPLQVENWRE